jgi:soluble P-type ATPase
VSDYNGTLALDGRLLPGVRDALTALSGALSIHVITADTFGLARRELEGLPLRLVITPAEKQAEAKLALVKELDEASVVALGNGRNDRLMLQAAALGIALLQREGTAAETLASADLVSPSVLDALDLLRQPLRLRATLRS